MLGETAQQFQGDGHGVHHEARRRAEFEAFRRRKAEARAALLQSSAARPARAKGHRRAPSSNLFYTLSCR